MKRLLVILSLLLFPAISFAGGPSDSTWFCRVVGNTGKQNTVFITKAWKDRLPNHYELRETDFTKFVLKLTDGQFRPSFKAKCRDYTDGKRAEKHRLLEMKTAKEYGFDIIELDWRWTPDVRTQAK